VQHGGAGGAGAERDDDQVEKAEQGGREGAGQADRDQPERPAGQARRSAGDAGADVEDQAPGPRADGHGDGQRVQGVTVGSGQDPAHRSFGLTKLVVQGVLRVSRSFTNDYWSY
jgi:hypothetical protein